MNDITALTVVFLCYSFLLVVIALYAKKYSASNKNFALGGRSLSGPVAALSAGAADMSSWLVMALPGACYLFGLSRIWLPISLLLGAFINWTLIAPRLRIYTEIANNSITLPTYFKNRFISTGRDFLSLVTSSVILIFFTFYAVAGFVSSGLLLELIFGLGYAKSLLLSMTIVSLYTVVGGFVAVSWVDFFQGGLMLISLILVSSLAIFNLNLENFNLIDSLAVNHFNITFNVKSLGLVSMFAWGLGYFGQPHILARFMAVKDVASMKVARNICTLWMFFALLSAIIVGTLGVFYIQNNTDFNPETILIVLANKLLNSWGVAVILAAMLSAILSTLSSLLIISSSILVEDVFLIKNKFKLHINRFIILALLCIYYILALSPSNTILQAVGFAWSGLGAAFGPAIIFSLYSSNTTKIGIVSGVLSGTIVVILSKFFIHTPGAIFYHKDILIGFELFPAFIVSSLCIYVVSKFSKQDGRFWLEFAKHL